MGHLFLTNDSRDFCLPLFHIETLFSTMSHHIKHISSKFLRLLFIVIIFQVSLNGQTDSLEQAEEWARSTFDGMSLDERIGQLLWLRAHSDKGPDHVKQVESFITKHHIGGLTFFQGTPEKQIELINQFQKLSKIPLMISMDAEWGLGMRFKKDGFSFPNQLTLGAIQENRLIYDMGVKIAEHLKRVGVHVNFAPVADINNNPKNPVINTRSFGEDRFNVTTKSYMYMKGMQDNGIMACAKHFPGHGDTDMDSHYDLPLINHSINRIDSLELYPFRVLADKGVQSMMVAHLAIPAIDDTPNLPTTLSLKAVTQLLKDSMGFNGLIITDGLGMKGVTKHYKVGEVEAKALQAGNDILLLPEDIEAAVTKIKLFLQDGRIKMADFENSVMKALVAKYQYGLTSFTPIDASNVREDIFSPEAKVLKRKLIEASLTMVRNRKYLIPFQKLDTLSLASIAVGADRVTDFQMRMTKYANVEHYFLKTGTEKENAQKYLDLLGKKEVVVVSLHDVSSYASKNFGFNDEKIAFIKDLAKRTKVVLTVFGTPYSLKYFDEIDWLQCAYQENEDTQDLAAQALFGAISMKGRLPVTASERSPFGAGVNTPFLFRLGYEMPEKVGINSFTLNHTIDSLAKDAVKTKSTPGCVVLVAKDGKIIFEKAYGYHSYSKKIKTKVEDIFDLASLTKVLATTLSVMKLDELEKVMTSKPMSKYLPKLKKTNKADLTVEEMMRHRAGLQTWLKFYLETLDESRSQTKPSSKFYASKYSKDFNITVADKLYLKKGYQDTIRQRIYDSELRKNKDYKYSDLGFYLLADMVRQQSKKPLDQFAKEKFYKPLGLKTATFNPLNYHNINRIPPTEKDDYFRMQEIHGHVHDMGAAMMGGVSGHAGLFANANDVAVLMQLLINQGYYGGKQYLEPRTIRKYTSRCSGGLRRGIGFDMYQMDKNEVPNMSEKASSRTFGHLGFTGTAAWADPENQIVYVILANRTYPKMTNKKYGRNNYRPKIQDAIYDSRIINKIYP